MAMRGSRIEGNVPETMERDVEVPAGIPVPLIRVKVILLPCHYPREIILT